MKEPQVLVTERAKLNLGSDSLRSKSSSQSVIDQVIEMLTAYVLKSDYNVDKAILNQQINDILSRLDNIPSMNIDDFLSLDSENPVQNKIITAALNAKPDKDTTYTAGTNVSIDSNNVISATDTTYTASDFDIKDLTDSTDLKSTWNNKQDKLTAGTNITIENNVISSTGGGNGLKQVDLTTYADGVEGEIVQHIGSTMNDYTHGYIYKSHLGHVDRYEDITIPAGSIKIVYTNKFDNTEKIVYTVDEVSKSVITNYEQGGKAYLIDSEFTDKLHTMTSIDWFGSVQSLIPTTSGLMYTVSETISQIFINEINDNTLLGVQNLYEYITSHDIYSGFRLTKSSQSINGRVTDIFMIVNVPIDYVNSNGSITKTTWYVYVRLSDLAKLDWDFETYINPIFPTVHTPNTACFDPTGTLRFRNINCIITSNDNDYLLVRGESAGQGSGGLYHTVSEDGTFERYISKTHIDCAYNSEPVSTESYWAQLIDVGLYFDYTPELQYTSESITIHRKITEYDEYGFPIDNPTGLIWQRIDVQPANQLTAGDGITIDSNNVISANLWTSVTD